VWVVVAKQQTTGPLQLPLNNCGVMAWITTEKRSHFYRAFACSRFTDPEVERHCEALSNIVWAPIKGGLTEFSANWMWACKTKEKMLVCTLP
jgi:phosphoribosylformylglycinamidine synthase